MCPSSPPPLRILWGMRQRDIVGGGGDGGGGDGGGLLGEFRANLTSSYKTDWN